MHGKFETFLHYLVYRIDNMVKKLEDSLQDEKERRSQRNKTRSRLEHLLRDKKSIYKRFINRLLEEL